MSRVHLWAAKPTPSHAPLRGVRKAIEKATEMAKDTGVPYRVWGHPDGSVTVHDDTPTWRSVAWSVAICKPNGEVTRH